MSDEKLEIHDIGFDKSNDFYAELAIGNKYYTLATTGEDSGVGVEVGCNYCALADHCNDTIDCSTYQPSILCEFADFNKGSEKTFWTEFLKLTFNPSEPVKQLQAGNNG